MKKVFIFSMLALILISGIYTPNSLQAQSKVQTYDEIMAPFIKDNGPGYAIQIDKGGNTIYKKIFGKADLELDINLQQDHVFRIGSITKQFTAACILKLMEEGKLNLKDDIQKYWPNFPSNGHTITVEHLLTHTSGIKSYTGMEIWDEETRKKDFTVEELINYFKDEPMDFAPGEKFAYNNSGYILLGFIIEKVSGMNYAEYLQNNIFEPFNMQDSYYGEHERIIKNRVKGYDKNDEGNVINAPYLSMTQPYAAGSILSTTNDLIKWNRAVMHGKFISKASLAMAHNDFTLNDGSKTGYGFGWGLVDLKGSQGVRHSGGINGFLTAGAYFLEEDVTLIVLSNCNCNSPEPFFVKLAAQAVGKPILPPKAIDVSPKLMDLYAGNYELSPDFIINILHNEGKLIGKAPGQPDVEMVPVREHGFVIEEINAKVMFNLKDGKVESLTLYQNGEHLAKRIE